MTFQSHDVPQHAKALSNEDGTSELKIGGVDGALAKEEQRTKKEQTVKKENNKQRKKQYDPKEATGNKHINTKLQFQRRHHSRKQE